MIVKRVDIWHLRLPFLSPIKHNLATHEGSENLVVKVTTAHGLTGYGEGVPRPFVTGETLEGSLAFLQKALALAAFQLAASSPQALMASLKDCQQRLPTVDYPAAFCAMEMALLDAAGRTWGKSLTNLLGNGTRESVIYSAVLPMASREQLAYLVNLIKNHGLGFLKLKVGGEADLDMLRMVREGLGWEVDVRVDANSAWDVDEAIERLTAMKPYRISAVEQPVPKEDFEGLKKVGQAIDLPIIADESLCTEADAQKLIDLQACQIFNLRLSKCGGLGKTLRIQQMAAQAGILCQLGCHVGETSILSAAGRHFACSSPQLVYVEGSFSPFLLTRDPVSPPVAFGNGGIGQALPGLGLGIEVHDRTLNELAVCRKIIS
jgi:L-alanine-DL-glutamate epimerase-like enolase superfamily enzyme